MELIEGLARMAYLLARIAEAVTDVIAANKAKRARHRRTR